VSEQDLIDRAQAAVGDHDRIVAAAWLRPRGESGGTLAGMDAGDGLGLAGGIAATVAGRAVGQASGGFTTDRHDGMAIRPVPRSTLLAVSAERLYAWAVTTEDHHRVPGAALFALALDEVEVSVHRRLTVRTFEVIHPPGAEKWEFEADYLGSHLKFVLAAIDGHP